MKWLRMASLSVFGTAALLGSLGCPGCDARAAAPGEEGNLRFYYTPVDGSTRFDRPIATGSGILVNMEPLGERRLERIISVEASPQAVATAQIESPMEPSVWVVGRSPGTSRISVEAQGGGETYFDATTFQVADVYEVALTHTCTRDASAAYLLDESIHLGLERKNRNGEVLVGSARSNTDALRTCQVFTEPEFYQDQIRCDEGGLHFDRALVDVVEDIWIDVANGVNTARGAHRELGLQVVGPEVVDFERPDADLRVDQSGYVQLYPVAFDTGLPICSDLSMRIFVETPQVCTGPGGATQFDVLPEDMNSFQIRGRRVGTCEFVVTLMEQPGVEFIFDAYVEP